jgi:probable phosphoglycerate mutase
VILVRHGDAVNGEGKFHGMIDDKLTPSGIKEAQEIVKRVKVFNPSTIYSSPLSRTTDTANVIGKALNIPVIRNKALLPLDLGAFIRKPTNRKNVEELKYYIAHPNIKIPSGESINHWAQKYVPFFNKYFFNKSPDTVIFVTHGRNILLSEADIKEGENLKFDNNILLESNKGKSTEHGGIAVADNNASPKFKILDEKKVTPGAS